MLVDTFVVSVICPVVLSVRGDVSCGGVLVRDGSLRVIEVVWDSSGELVEPLAVDCPVEDVIPVDN